MESMSTPLTIPANQPSREGVVLTKAAIRASDRLGLSQKALGGVLGLSASVISRMRSGTYVLEQGKAFELAVLFVRLFRSLDAIVNGDELSAREWMKSKNLVLGAPPIDLIAKVQGLVNVIQYLDTRRAII
jgi:hypothetical protein